MIVTDKGSYAMLFLVGGGSFCMGIVKIFFIDTKSYLWYFGEVPMETSSGVNSHLIFDHPKQKKTPGKYGHINGFSSSRITHVEAFHLESWKM